MWLEEHLGKRINVERTEEAISTGAGTMGVACPFCLIMLDDGAKAKGERIQVFDVAQVLARSIQTEPRQGEAATRPIRP
jgi:Fe-S oxidoreductase